MISKDSVVDILIVEDDPNDVKLAIYALKKGHVANAVHVARDGAEALDYLLGDADEDGGKRVLPRVVFLDIKLPKVDGLEVLRRLRSDPRTTNLPVVMVTSSHEDRDIAAGYQYRANSYVVKPIDFAQFSQAMSSLGMYWLLLNTPPGDAVVDAAGAVGDMLPVPG